MPPGDIPALVPVIQVKIVEKRPPQQADFPGTAPQPEVEPIGNARHPQAMLVGGDRSVLDELPHQQCIGIFRHIVQDLPHPSFFRRGQFTEHRHAPFSLSHSNGFIILDFVRQGNGFAKILHHKACFLQEQFPWQRVRHSTAFGQSICTATLSVYVLPFRRDIHTKHLLSP